MPLKHVLEVLETVDAPEADGAVVRELFVRRGWDGVQTETVKGEAGTIDFVKVVVPGSGGKTNGGGVPTLGILGRLGGLGARPGSVAALGAALKLVDMSLRGDVLDGDVVVCTCAPMPRPGRTTRRLSSTRRSTWRS